MKAVVMTAAGTPDVLQAKEVAEPVLNRDSQIKVWLRAAGINPIDTKIRSRGLFFPDALPAVIGCDGAGVVVEAGKAVRNFKVGDQVWFCHGGLGREQGNYAEYTVLEAGEAAAMPANLDFIQAAAGPLVLITAWEALFDRASLQPGQTVLIHAGAGGVGHVAIQLARHRGARVATTVGSADKAEFVKQLGAEKIILYKEENVVDTIMDWTDGKGVDLAFDTIGADVFKQSIETAAHYGKLVTLLDPGNDIVWKEARNRNLSIIFELMLTPMLRDLPEARAHQIEILNECRDLLEQGELKLELSETLLLAEAAQAHAMIEQGHTRGKIVLRIDE